ncbi:MAG: glucose-6-phosphate dehydrogenase assembly protein OpcA [Herpetosiphonaceae bacterium]|nr:glucose-6-phosphate dehydrogenase assembly protein OpcA [Herpetosiphonaceae bacterium]
MTTIPLMELDADPTGTLSHEAIESMLHAIWDDLNKSNPTSRTRVRTLNLLIYVPETPSDEVRNEIARVALAHPGRTITIHPEAGPAHAEVTVACRVGGSAEACSEQIMLRGGDSDGEALLSLALALLHPGLPVALWWYGPPAFARRPFVTLLDAADHVLVDSRTWPEPYAPLRQLAEIRKHYMGNLRFSDLQWVAITPWRQQIAQAFDAQMVHEIMPAVNAVVIRYNGPQYVVGAWLLAGWLMSSLGWQLADGPVLRDQTGVTIPLQAAGRPMTLALRTQGPGDGITGLSLHPAASAATSFSCELLPDGVNVIARMEVAGSAPLERVTPRLRLPMTMLIGEELALGNNDPIYTRTLDLTIALAEKLRGSL